MYADYHIHTNHSIDSMANMEDYCVRAIELGIQEICFTDHVDYDVFGTKEGIPQPQTISYKDFFNDVNHLKTKYRDNLNIKIGVEFGVQLHTIPQYFEDVKHHHFDFILLSSHEIDRQEFWLYDYQKGKTQLEIHQGYYQNILAMIQQFDHYSVLGHLDVIKRYDEYGHFDDSIIMETHIKPILEHLIKHGKGLEINASSFQYNLPDLMPSTAILKRYYELGGTILTIGSDAHKVDALGLHQDIIKNKLKEIGFQTFCTFDKMKPQFHTL